MDLCLAVCAAIQFSVEKSSGPIGYYGVLLGHSRFQIYEEEVSMKGDKKDLVVLYVVCDTDGEERIIHKDTGYVPQLGCIAGLRDPATGAVGEYRIQDISYYPEEGQTYCQVSCAYLRSSLQVRRGRCRTRREHLEALRARQPDNIVTEKGRKMIEEVKIEEDKLLKLTPYQCKALLPVFDAARTDTDGGGRSIGAAADAVYRLLLKHSKMEIGVCTLPPPGWVCSRPEGHEGPCAASSETTQ